MKLRQPNVELGRSAQLFPNAAPVSIPSAHSKNYEKRQVQAGDGQISDHLRYVRVGEARDHLRIHFVTLLSF